MAGSAKLNAALEYARRGWPVFPVHSVINGRCSCGGLNCDHPGKHPRVDGGFHAATTDQDQLVTWWRESPDANLGLACGEAGLTVIDIDAQHGGLTTWQELRRELGPEIERTRRVLTPSGGKHLYFRAPAGTTILSSGQGKKLGAGIEVKATGGYVILPPSTHVRGVYRWDQETVSLDPAPLPFELLQRLLDLSPGNCEARVSVLPEIIPEGQRNATLASLAGSMRRRGASQAAIEMALLEENVRCSPPLTEDEVRSIARSVARYAPATTRIVEHHTAPFANGSRVPATSLPTWPAPLAPEAFYGLVGDVVRVIEPHSEADPAALLAQILVATGNMIGRRAHFKAEDDWHGLNLFLALVGDTSKGRKGSAWGRIRRGFSAVDPQWAASCIQSGLSSGEGLICNVRDPIERQDPVKEHGRVVDYETVIADPGIEDKRLLMIEPEFSRTLRVMDRDGNTLSPVVRQAWDSGNLRVLTKTMPAKATDAHISIIGHITRDELRRYLTTTEAGNGFANRFLWVCVRRSKILPEGGSVEEAALAPMIERLKSAIVFGQQLDEIKRDEDARAIWYAIYPELSEGHQGLLGAVTSRAEAQVMRLACVYAVLDCSSVIRPEHLRAALAVWDYVGESCGYIFGSALGDPLADRIFEALIGVGTGGLTRTEIRDLFGRHARGEDVDRALGLLKELGRVRPQHYETGGRSAERWVVIPITPPSVASVASVAPRGALQ